VSRRVDALVEADMVGGDAAVIRISKEKVIADERPVVKIPLTGGSSDTEVGAFVSGWRAPPIKAFARRICRLTDLM
jgi:hypothetical protein